MTETRTLKVLVKGNADVVDCVLSTADGGRKLERGVRERVAASFPGYSLEVFIEPSAGFEALHEELASGASPLAERAPDIVVLSAADDAAALSSRMTVNEEALAAVRSHLVSAIDLIKSEVGAHVLVANVSTFEPGDETSNYHGLATEPFSLRAHRLDLMLVGVSHDTGISVIDVDRCIAELGAAGNVAGPADYGPAGCSAVADEFVRVLEDYGFFDERSVLAQVGAS